jgi:hypothetical protein
MQLQKLLAWRAVHHAYRGKSSYDDKLKAPPPPKGPPPTAAIKAAVEHRKLIANLLSGAKKPPQSRPPIVPGVSKNADDMKAERIRKLKEADRLRGQKMQAMERRLYPQRFE